MTRLRLSVPLGDGESATSFCSRLAFRNGCDTAREFCLDMGLKFQDIVDGCPQALARLAALGGVTAGVLTRFSIRRTVGVDRYLYAGQTITRIGLRRSRIRFCPACLMEDQRRWPELGAAAPFGRTDWLLSPIRTCAKHGLPLLEAADNDEWMLLHDFSKALRPHLDNLPQRLHATQAKAPSRLETYLRARLAGAAQSATAWLNALPFYAACRLCEIVGAVDLYGPRVKLSTLTEDQWRAAGGAGFGIAESGEAGIRSLLVRLRTSLIGRAILDPRLSSAASMSGSHTRRAIRPTGRCET
jgi:hypothetical protein